jgi:membrane-associated protease RseP (regulator of RpoE activity)
VHGWHLVAAVLGRVRSDAGIGLPPRLATLGRVRGTIVSLNWIPLGGFVRPAGEFGGSDSHADALRDPGDFVAKPRRIQAMVLAAGPAVNLLTAFVVLWAAFMLGGPDNNLTRGLEVNPGSPAEAAGLLTGDIVHWRTYPGPNGEPSLSQMLRLSAGRRCIRGQRDRAILSVELTPPGVAGDEDRPGSGRWQSSELCAPLEAARPRSARRCSSWCAARLRRLREDGRLASSASRVETGCPTCRWKRLDPLVFRPIHCCTWWPLIHIGLALTNLLPIPASTADGWRCSRSGRWGSAGAACTQRRRGRRQRHRVDLPDGGADGFRHRQSAGEIEGSLRKGGE